MAELKKVKEVFSDYKTQSNIQKADIEKMNLIKKQNTLEIILHSDEYLEIKEIWYFESFLMERFQFSQVNMIIKYSENVEINSIEKEWKNLICYMTHKYPLMKPMLLLKSIVEIKDKDINVNMHIRGADFLKARKLDKELEKVIHNLFSKTYKINLYEKISPDEQNEIERENKKIVEEAVEHAKMLAKIPEQHQEQEEHYQKQEAEFNQAATNIPLPEEAEYIPPEEMPFDIDEPIQENYIMGKPSRAKEKQIEIKEINAESGRITIEGRIITCECKETKSGKGMLVFEIYDGTGLITCKSFAKDAAEGNEICAKIKEAKAIKATGKAGLDTYAGDVTIMANTIVSTLKEVPEMPEEADEDTPLILGKNMDIQEPLVKVKDLNVDDGKVCLDGEVIFMEDKELKSGKTLLSFDLYDGTSTLTCKAFLEKNNAKKIIRKNQKSKRN